MPEISMNCAWDKERPCNKSCASYNKTDLNGTHCVRLYADISKSEGVRRLGVASESFVSTLQNLAGLLTMGGFGKQ